MKHTIEEKLEQFLNQLNPSLVHAHFDDKLNIDKEAVSTSIGIYANESRVAFMLIKKHLDKNIRILEVGAGLCLLSVFLKINGYNITALEPATGGFDDFRVLKNAILSVYGDNNLLVLEQKAEQLNPDIDGVFDLIFSNNVLEHIPNLSDAIKGMKGVLSTCGTMIHSCPNYFVPYEPHLGIPVWHLWPKLSGAIWGQKIADNQKLWNSLNYINYFQLKKMVNQHNLKISFEKQTMFSAFSRLGEDEEFAKRHQNNFVGILYTIGSRLHILTLLKFFPAWLSTPMKFEIRHDN